MKTLAAALLAVLLQAAAVGQSKDESNQKHDECAMLAGSLMRVLVHAIGRSPETAQGVTAASVYGDRYSADDNECYIAIEYQIPDNNQRDCSFLTLARVSLKDSRGQMKVAETRWCRQSSDGAGPSDYMSTSPSDICHGGGNKQSDYTCVQAFIKNSVEANK